MASHEGFAIFLKKMGSGVPGCQCRPEPAGRPVWLPHSLCVAAPRPLCGCHTASLWLPYRPRGAAREAREAREARAVPGKSGGTAGPDSHTDTHPRSLPRAAGGSGIRDLVSGTQDLESIISWPRRASIPQPWGHIPWSLGPGPWSLVPGSQSLVAGSWSLGPGPRVPVLGPWGPLGCPWGALWGPLVRCGEPLRAGYTGCVCVRAPDAKTKRA